MSTTKKNTKTYELTETGKAQVSSIDACPICGQIMEWKSGVIGFYDDVIQCEVRFCEDCEEYQFFPRS